MRDLTNNISMLQPLNPVGSTTTKTSSAVDLQGFDSGAVIVLMGLSGDTLSGSVFWTLKLQESDSDSTGFTDVVLANLTNGAATYVVNSSALDETCYSFGYIGSKRYIRAVATSTGTHTNGTPIGMLAIRGRPNYRPTA